MTFYLGLFNLCGGIAAIALPIIATVNVCCCGKLNATREDYLIRWPE
jgi:hypothetical protein